MPSLDYPYDMNCLWLGADGEGSLAVFITAGSAPIPKPVLTPAYLDAVDDLLAELRPRTTANILAKNALPESFADLASLGLHVYDWQHGQGSAAAASGGYDLVATPAAPLALADLPADARVSPSLAISFPLPFRDTAQLDPRAHHDCAEPDR